MPAHSQLLQDLNFNKINDSLFFDFIRTAPCLLSLHLERVEVSSHFVKLLTAF